MGSPSLLCHRTPQSISSKTYVEMMTCSHHVQCLLPPAITWSPVSIKRTSLLFNVRAFLEAYIHLNAFQLEERFSKTLNNHIIILDCTQRQALWTWISDRKKTGLTTCTDTLQGLFSVFISSACSSRLIGWAVYFYIAPAIVPFFIHIVLCSSKPRTWMWIAYALYIG